MMTSDLLKQIKQRRLQLGLKQQDMYMRVGISRQQYQRLESKGNPRLDTLELVAQGLESELLLIPKHKIDEVRQLLSGAFYIKSGMMPIDGEQAQYFVSEGSSAESVTKSLVDDPWQGLLGDDD